MQYFSDPKTIMDYPPNTWFIFEDATPTSFRSRPHHPRGHVDGYYDTAKAEAALGDAVQVADLLETLPWNPTVQEMPVATAFERVSGGTGMYIKPCK